MPSGKCTNVRGQHCNGAKCGTDCPIDDENTWHLFEIMMPKKELSEGRGLSEGRMLL